MPAPVPLDDNRAAPRLTILFRAGLAVAALAALLLLVADGNGLMRIAAVLAITAVAMMNLSVALRPDTAAQVRLLADEIDELRAELATVARSAGPTADPARWPVESAGDRIDEARPAVGPSRAGRARLTATGMTGVEPARPTVDEPEPQDAGPVHGPRRAVATERPRTASASGRRRAEEPEDDHGPPEPAGERRRVGEPPAGRRRADDREDGRRPSAEPVTGRRRAADPDGEPFADHRAAEDWYVDREPVDRPRSTSRYASARPAGGVYGGPPRLEGHDGRPGGASGPEVPPRPVGVVRHTETVHVTTRHTVVDGTADPSTGGYGRWTPPEEQPWTGRAPDEQPWTGRAPERADRWDGYPQREDDPRPGPPRGSARPGPPAEHHDRSWTAPPTGPGPEGARPRPGPDDRPGRGGGGDRPGRRGAAEWPGHGGGPDGPDPRTSAGGRGRYTSGVDEWHGHPGGERSGPVDGDSRSRRGGADRSRPGRAYPSADAGADDWSEVRAGGRWATVREDEHGRELRMGERRAAVHADGDATELRVEDHWAAVRRPRRGDPDDGYDRDEPERGADPGYPRRGGHRSEPERALPPGGVPVPEQWRPARGRPADGRSTAQRPGEESGRSASPAEPATPGWSPQRGRRQDDDWPEPSPRRSEPEPDRYGRPARDQRRRTDDAPERWR